MPITKPPVFPESWAETGDKVQPTNPEISEGWIMTNLPPARQRFNWFFNYVMNGIRYFCRRGLPDWDSNETYDVGDSIIGPDNKLYRSLTLNTNKSPAANPGDWRIWLSAVSDIPLATTPTAGIASLATTPEIAALNASKIMTAAAFFGDSTLIPNGHYILPGGVILNWGFSSVQDDGYQIVTFHKPFVSAVFMAGATPRANGPIGAGNALGAHVGTVTLNTMGVGASMYAGFAIAGVYWWALGK